MKDIYLMITRKINKHGLVLKYTIFIHHCIMISLTQLVTECICSVVSITRGHNLKMGKKVLIFWVLKWQIFLSAGS